jgi:hypothetical protein
MTTLVTAQTTTATSNAFAVSGVVKVICNLGIGETVQIQEEFPDGVYRDAIDRDGVTIMLTNKQKSLLFEGYGNYKAVKSVTVASLAVGLEA